MDDQQTSNPPTGNGEGETLSLVSSSAGKSPTAEATGLSGKSDPGEWESCMRRSSRVRSGSSP